LTTHESGNDTRRYSVLQKVDIRKIEFAHFVFLRRTVAKGKYILVPNGLFKDWRRRLA